MDDIVLFDSDGNLVQVYRYDGAGGFFIVGQGFSLSADKITEMATNVGGHTASVRRINGIGLDEILTIAKDDRSAYYKQYTELSKKALYEQWTRTDFNGVFSAYFADIIGPSALQRINDRTRQASTGPSADFDLAGLIEGMQGIDLTNALAVQNFRDMILDPYIRSVGNDGKGWGQFDEGMYFDPLWQIITGVMLDWGEGQIPRWDRYEAVFGASYVSTARGFVNQVEPKMLKPTGLTTEEGLKEAEDAAALSTYQNFVRQLQMRYGEEKGRKLLGEWKERFRSEFSFADKWREDDFWKAGKFEHFKTWIDVRVGEEDERLSEIERKDIELENRTRLYAEYQEFSPTLGIKLYEFAMARFERAGGQYGELSWTAFPTPEDVLKEFVPAGYETLADWIGIDVESLFPTDMVFTDAEVVKQAVNANMLAASQAALASGNLSSEVAEDLRMNLNEIIRTMPSEGERQFYQTQSGAEAQFQTWLAKNMDPGQYREAAWAYRPQLWEHYKQSQNRATPEGEQPFEDLMGQLGSTFFARLTPKKERVSGPKTARLPGGGRIPMQ